MRGAKDIGRQPAVSGAGFDEIEAGLKSCATSVGKLRGLQTCQDAGHLGDLDFEELAEDAGRHRRW